MGQRVSTLLQGNLSAAGLGSSVTADQVTEGLDLSRHTAIVTGGSSGIGKETARVLAKRGARVILAARGIDGADDTKKAILLETPAARVDMIPLDLTNCDSIRTFAKTFESKDVPLNILINNAGVMNKEFQSSDMGIEQMFATHVVGPFLLTHLLLKKLKQSAQDSGIESRVVMTGSEAHRINTLYGQGIDFDLLKDSQRYEPIKAYSQSKVAVLALATEFTNRLKEENAKVTVNVAQPGATSTQLGRDFITTITPGPDAVTDEFYKATEALYKSPEMGAATICFVATRPEVKGISGRYFSDCKVLDPNPDGQNPDLHRQVWDYCHQVVDGAAVPA